MPQLERWPATFDELYEATSRRVLAYALRRSESIDDAEEVTAETFIVAWRRLEEIPADPLPWLLAVARRIAANRRRGTARWRRLLDRMSGRPHEGQYDMRREGGPATDALRRLPQSDQELLRLVAWEGLDHAAIAQVLGITPNAVAIRLHRTRGRFALEIGAARSDSAHSSDSTKGNGQSRTPLTVNGMTDGETEQSA